MTYDFFADIWNSKKLMGKFKDLTSDEWSRIRGNRNIKWESKARELVKSLENSAGFFKDIVEAHLNRNTRECENLYAKFLLVLKVFVACKDTEMKEKIHEILQDRNNGLKNYKREEIDKMDISESPKDAYKEFFMDYVVPQNMLDLLDSLSLKRPKIELKILPKCSFFLSIEFTLQKPFISKDDEGFYIHDNPVSKEKVFKIPYIRTSSWKGNLRWAFGKANGPHEDDERILRIFGNKKGEEAPENLRKGRLYVYPTFFDQISLDIINPHDRITKTGKNPITLEVVPKGRRGYLHLLYMPYDKIGEDDKEIKEEIETDLLFLCKAVGALLTEYGMSAKRTSGYGVAQIGEITFRSILLKEYEEYTDFGELVDELTSRYLKYTSREGDGE
jgi:CRISPR-associated protein Cmr2